MNGLEIARAYYEQFGKPMIENNFSDLLPYIAVGFVGNGSEHYGYDDFISRDHDVEPGFCLFLPGEEIVSRKRAFELERAYAKLPKEFEGLRRQLVSPVGGNRNGVIRTADFYKNAVGSATGDLSVTQWLHIPDYALADTVNGEVYYDSYGEFSTIREKICNMPKDIVYKRIAGNLLIMGQSGQYNFERCIKHGEIEAAQLACVEFVTSLMKVLFLINGKYMPYYKWGFRALKQITDVQKYSDVLPTLLFGDNRDATVVNEKIRTIEQLSVELIQDVKNTVSADLSTRDLESCAYSVNDLIKDSAIRNMHILEAI